MLNFPQLVKERNAWVAHNFPNHTEPPPGESIQGCIEELGELAHARLKKAQSIRGSDDEHDANAKDAIGDLTVYLLGVMSAWNVYPDRGVEAAETGERHALGLLALWLGYIDAAYHGENTTPFSTQFMVNRVVALCMAYCRDHDWDYEAIAQGTWDHVKVRDWIAYPDTGMPPEHDAADDNAYLRQAAKAASMHEYRDYKKGDVIQVTGMGADGWYQVDSVVGDAITVHRVPPPTEPDEGLFYTRVLVRRKDTGKEEKVVILTDGSGVEQIETLDQAYGEGNWEIVEDRTPPVVTDWAAGQAVNPEDD